MCVTKFRSVFLISRLRHSVSAITVAIAHPRFKDITGNLDLHAGKRHCKGLFILSLIRRNSWYPHGNVMADVLFWSSTFGFLKLEETGSCDQYESYLSWNITVVTKNVLEEYESGGLKVLGKGSQVSFALLLLPMSLFQERPGYWPCVKLSAADV